MCMCVLKKLKDIGMKGDLKIVVQFKLLGNGFELEEIRLNFFSGSSLGKVASSYVYFSL